jgi:hypothetical protein
MKIQLYSDGFTIVESPETNDVTTFFLDDGFEIKESKVQAEFISDRGALAAIREDFVWETHKGRFQYPRDMATPHLIHAVNMIWRNWFGLKNDYPEIKSRWSDAYVRRALSELTNELNWRI